MLEDIAERIADGDRSFDLQVALTQAEAACAKIQNLEGLKLLNRIGLLLSTEGGKATRYSYVQEIVEALPLLNPAEDARALRSLAYDVRARPEGGQE